MRRFRFLLRRDTTAGWLLKNPVPYDGELVYDKTTKTFKVGDGVTPWADLADSGGGSAVVSVNGRTGPVVGLAEAADLAAESSSRAAADALLVATSDLPEAVQDLIGGYIAAGANLTKSYDDATGVTTLSVVAPGEWVNTDPEVVRDTIGGALAAGANIVIAVNDAGDTITISTPATVNATDAQLRDRTTHTGVQAIATITGLQTALSTIPATEDIQDAVGAFLVAGANVTLTYDDVANTLTVSATDTTLSTEQVQDIVGALLADTGTVDVTYNDAGNILSMVVAAGSITEAMLAFSVATQGELDAVAAAIPSWEAIEDRVAGLLVAGSNVTLSYDDTTGALTISGAGAVPLDIQVFTTSGTWTKPTAGQTQVRWQLLAGGGGAGSGGVNDGTATASANGGGAGGGGGYTEVVLPISSFGATEPVVVGLGGAGGAAVGGTVQVGSGLNGVAGGNTTVGAGPSLRATGGAAGLGNGNAGGAGTGGFAGGAGGVGTPAGNGGTGASAGGGAGPGGGGGGAYQASPAASRSGGTGGVQATQGVNASAAPKFLGFAGGGGSGGAAGGGNGTSYGNGGVGNNGAQGAGGGGGGAARTDGVTARTSGKGGNGGDGIVVVTSW